MKMKKLVLTTISLVFALLMLVNNVEAQKKYVNKALMWAESGEKLDTALGAIKFAESQEELKEWGKTYYAMGAVYNAISTTENPEFMNLVEHPAVKAFESYEKAYNMKGASSYKNTIDMQLLTLVNVFINNAIDAYNAENYKEALMYFEKTLEVKKMEVFAGEIDTAVIFNAALTATRIKEYDKAIEYYKEAIKYKYAEGDAIAYLAQTYRDKGDTELYIATLKEGFEQYPSNQSLLGSIINFYLLETENSDEAFKYLALAREKDPTNPQFYSAEAHLYDKVGEKDKAKEKYKKAIELDPGFFEAYYNLGVLYFNEGVELTDEANKITNNEEYEKAKKIADDKFKEALPYIEKSHELKSDDNSIMQTLKTLYYRLQMTDKYNEINAKLAQ